MSNREKVMRAMYVQYCAIGETLRQGFWPAYEDADPLTIFQLGQYADAAINALAQSTGTYEVCSLCHCDDNCIKTPRDVASGKIECKEPGCPIMENCK